jgi:hypothetical protein
MERFYSEKIQTKILNTDVRMSKDSDRKNEVLTVLCKDSDRKNEIKTVVWTDKNNEMLTEVSKDYSNRNSNRLSTDAYIFQITVSNLTVQP